MNQLVTLLYRDETGFVISSELILIATVAVLSLVVGLAEISHGVNQELEDVGSALGAMQQSYRYQGLASYDKGAVVGSFFDDDADYCDSQYDIVGTRPVGEGNSGYHYGNGGGEY